MDANVSRIKVGNGGGRTAVDKFNWDGAGVGLRLQIVFEEKEGSRKLPEAPESTRASTEMGSWPGMRMWTERVKWQGVGKGGV